MILPHHSHRFEGDSGLDIASHVIDVRFPDGESRKIVLRLGAPFKKKDRWWIRTELENLDSTEGPLGGADSFHTLLLGIKWIIGRLQVFEEKVQCRYFWDNTEDLFDYRLYFAIGEEGANQSTQPSQAPGPRG